MATEDSKIQLKHPDHNKAMPRISTEKYEAIRQAILQTIPDDEQGIRFKILADRVARLLPEETLETIGLVGWYTTSVKLDLEARGLIERVPGSQPQRLRQMR